MFLLFFAGENATLSCKIGSVPTSKVRWYRDGTEVLNNSLVNRGQQKFVIFERGGFEKTSSLILTNARAEDSGPFMCVSNNQAGRVEANFTLQVCKEIFASLYTENTVRLDEFHATFCWVHRPSQQNHTVSFD